MITAREIVQKIESLEPAIAAAYYAEIQATVDAVTLAQVEQLLQQGDTEGLADMLQTAGFIVVIEGIRTAFLAGGRFEVAQIVLPRSIPKLQFDIRAPANEAWLKSHSDELVRRLQAEQRQAIRETVTAGIARQQPIGRIAQDIVGRVSPQTGRRTGGVIGLSSNQAKAVAAAKDQLLSGDAALLKRYLLRERRDRRLDGIVKRAIKAGKPVAKVDADRIAGRYAERLLKLRGESLAQTEAVASFGAARHRVYQQIVGISPEQISKTWRSRSDMQVRHSHRTLDGQKVGLYQPFQSETGAQLQYPGDTTLGAGAEDVIGCRCSAIYRVRFK